jgi:hypothetical protein
MEKGIGYADEPPEVDLENAVRVKDFLPSPKDLVFRTERVVTVRLDDSTVSQIRTQEGSRRERFGRFQFDPNVGAGKIDESARLFVTQVHGFFPKSGNFYGFRKFVCNDISQLEFLFFGKSFVVPKS